MNTQLIRLNLDKIAKLMEEEQPVQAVGAAFSLARTMLKSSSAADAKENDRRAMYIAYAGCAAAMQECYAVMLREYTPAEDAAVLIQKLNVVNEQIAECTMEMQQIETGAKELLDKETELKSRQKALEEKKKTRL